MISDKHKCIFIHCHKCAGETIELAISGKADKGFEGDPYEGSPEKHFSVNQYIKKYGQDIWQDYFTFSFVRNPWDRVISWIFYRDKRWKLYGGKINPSIIKQELEQFKCFHRNTFNNLLSLDDASEIDFIGKFENLQQDFNTVCDKIGIPQQELPHVNKTNRKHYTEYYDDETREIVAQKYAKDIEYFGYKFED
jgi:hypothetical protein